MTESLFRLLKHSSWKRVSCKKQIKFNFWRSILSQTISQWVELQKLLKLRAIQMANVNILIRITKRKKKKATPKQRLVSWQKVDSHRGFATNTDSLARLPVLISNYCFHPLPVLSSHKKINGLGTSPIMNLPTAHCSSFNNHGKNYVTFLQVK